MFMMAEITQMAVFWFSFGAVLLCGWKDIFVLSLVVLSNLLHWRKTVIHVV